MRKSFTLIELLVVIAIIGLLTSIVLVSTQGLQGKARITKTLEFSKSVQHVLGAYAVGIWSFDDQANPTKDGSGYDNNGTITGAIFSPNTPYEAIGRGTGKYALSFDGNDYVDAGNKRAGTWSAFTISAWVYPTLDKSWSAIFQTANVGDRALYRQGDKLQFYSSCNSTKAVPLNVWTHVGVTVDSGDNIVYYVNGEAGGG